MCAVDLVRRIPSLFHFTDRRNLPVIRELGGLYPLADLRQQAVDVPVPGGNQLSHDLDRALGLDRYVHLCFKPNHPMEFRAREEGRIIDSIFLQVHPSVLSWPNVLFAPGVANKVGVPRRPIDEAANLIDFEVLYAYTNWRDSGIQERLQQAERSEVLVPNQIPLELIRNLPDG